MNSVIQEIEKIRNGKPFQMIDSFYNRYSVVCRESDGSRTAYCFSVPIRNNKTGELVDLRFSHRKNGSVLNGSEDTVTITDRARFANTYGCCEVFFKGRLTKKTVDTIQFSDADVQTEIRPTLNGLLFVLDCKANAQPEFVLKTDRIFDSTRANDRYFSVMREKFVPLVTVSCIGLLNAKGKVTSPCRIENEQTGEKEYTIRFVSESKSRFRVAVEINMQETKLFQDTTVESNFPKRNNAFGSVAFLGKSRQFGEQWLYSRLESINIRQLQNKKILKTILHIPQLGTNKKTLSVRRVVKRFCSFGSNWENKIAVFKPVAESTVSNGYQHLDISEILGSLKNKSENYVIQAPNANSPIIVSTGDCFHAPQILEVQFQ